ncbi:hypothetical protein VTI74DRAFT_1268 [Chaetomium olivicolor]
MENPNPKPNDTTTPQQHQQQPCSAHPSSTPKFQTPLEALQHLYGDVTRLRDIASPSLILHPADRALFSPPRPPIAGLAAAQRHEEELMAATGGTLVMDVASMQATAWFGCVMGVLRAGPLPPPPPAASVTPSVTPGGFGMGEGDDGNGVEGADGEGEGDRDGGSSSMDGDEQSGEGAGKEGRQKQREKGGWKGGERGKFEVPFCGVWRFDEDGRAVEHWENAADPAALARWLQGE